MDLAKFDLNLMRVLDALLREGSTVRAGQRIGLSQPAVSAALGRLRRALGDELFLRRGHGLEPTDFARTLAVPLREALDHLEILLNEPGTFDPGTATDKIRLSGSDFFAELLMPPLADAVSQRAPGIRAQFLGLPPTDNMDAMKRYEIDIVLMPTVPHADWADRQSVMECDFRIIARAGHPRLSGDGLQPGDTVPIDLFCDLGHVIFSSEGNVRAFGDEALERMGRERRVVMTLPYFFGVFRAVSESDLIAFVPHQLAARLSPVLGLTVYEPPVSVDAVEISMFWHRRSAANPAHRWVRDLIADILARYP